jgi:DNA helicase IV
MSDEDRSADGPGAELAREQAYVAMLYDRVDELRARTSARLERALGADGGTRAALLDRDALVGSASDRLSQLTAAEYGLAFGRLDLADGERRYVGRIGLLDDEREPLLVDWRAPAAQPYYRATAAAPQGVVRRRHLRLRHREVLGYDDDVLDLEALGSDEVAQLNGEAALMAALTANRTGRMGDIIATIQAEQDRIIRSDLNGVLVVQGGPGTGKTVVALHRVAYLLYTYRDRLAGRGVLVVGPNPTFLHYIDQVLPSLGENDVLLTTVGELYPGVRATGTEPVETATVKGDLRMAKVIERAVRDRERLPRREIKVRVGNELVEVPRDVLEKARNRARSSRAMHNDAARYFGDEIIEYVTDQLTARIAGRVEEGVDELVKQLLGDDPDDDFDDGPLSSQVDRKLVRDDVAGAPEVRSLLYEVWPRLTPQRLLTDLFASRRRLEAASQGILSRAEQAALRRAPVQGAQDWTPADVPLLDEAAELLGGGDEREARAESRRRRREAAELEYAKGVLDVIGEQETERLTASRVAGRFTERRALSSVAERAASDRTWNFGHVVVDEAQELSAMAWRVLARRNPARSMTVVGDIAQRGAAWGASSWDEVLDPDMGGRWRLTELSVNYRTPTEIMAVAGDVLATLGEGLEPPRSVRDSGVAPWRATLSPDDHAGLARLVAAELAGIGEGKLAVLAPADEVDGIGRSLAGAIEGVAVGEGPAALDAPVAVLSVTESKGLEFDAVLVVDPDRVLAESGRGASDLYVALTRATKRLGVVSPGPLPEMLHRLVPYSPASLGR